jgi:hypothetical protein
MGTLGDEAVRRHVSTATLRMGQPCGSTQWRSSLGSSLVSVPAATRISDRSLRQQLSLQLSLQQHAVKLTAAQPRKACALREAE